MEHRFREAHPSVSRILTLGLLTALAGAFFFFLRDAPSAEAAPPQEGITLTGHATYRDALGNEHPIRRARVTINDSPHGPDSATPVGQVETDNNGDYRWAGLVRRFGNALRLTVHIDAHSDSLGTEVLLCCGTGYLYNFEVSRTVPVSTNVVVNLTTPPDVLQPVAPGPVNSAFNMFDAAVLAKLYDVYLTGSSLTFLPIQMPFRPIADHQQSYYAFFANKNLYLTYQDSVVDKNWGVVLHEMGHHFATETHIDFREPAFGLPELSNTGHSPGQNLARQYGKDLGTQWAWSEGVADFYAKGAENDLGAPPGTPFTGGSVFRDGYDLAAPSAAGEDDEAATARFLWFVRSQFSTRNTVAAIENQGGRYLSTAVPALLTAMTADPGKPVQAQRGIETFGCKLSDLRVAPTLTKPSPGTKLDPDNPPTFGWNPGGAGIAFPLDTFHVVVWDEKYENLVFTSDEIHGLTWTPSSSDWKKITDFAHENGPKKIVFAVRGESSTAPNTGPYTGCGVPLAVRPTLKASGIPFPPLTSTCGFAEAGSQFHVVGDNLTPGQYELKLKGTVGGVTLDQDVGLLFVDSDGHADQTFTLPQVPAHQSWALEATPPDGNSDPVTTKLWTSWTACVRNGAEDAQTQFTTNWSGSGFKPGSEVRLAFNNSVVATATVGQDGSFSSTTRNACPPGVTFAQYVFGTTLDEPAVVLKTGDTARCTGIGNVYGAPYDPILHDYYGIDLSHPTAYAGGFKPNETVTFTANGKALGSGVSDAYGSVEATLTIPAQPSGWYVLTAKGVLGDSLVGWLQSDAKTPLYAASYQYNGDGTFTAHILWDGVGWDSGSTLTAATPGGTFTANADTNGSFSSPFDLICRPGDQVTVTGSAYGGSVVTLNARIC